MAPLDGGTFCLNHAPDPKAQKARSAARRAGGRARAEQQSRAREAAPEASQPWGELQDFDDCETALRHVARETLARRMSAREASAATVAIKALMRAMSLADQAESEQPRTMTTNRPSMARSED